MLLKNKVFEKLKFKFTKKCVAIILVFLNEEKIQEDSDDSPHRKLTLKIRYWYFFDKD